MPVDHIWNLLTKKFNNEISPEELEELERLLRQNQDAFQLNELFANLHNSRLKPVSDERMKQRSANTIKDMIGLNTVQEEQSAANDSMIYPMEDGRYRRSKAIRTVTALFACFALVATIVWMTQRKVKLPTQVAMNEVKTDASSRSTINLPDGSVVVLNTGSKLSYNKEFGISSREIKLIGEAYFDVHKNPEMPLVVHAGSVDISVKGTTFNVKAYPEDSTVEAALLTGIIELVSHKDPERKILLRPNEKIIVSDANTNTSIPAINNTAAGNETVSLQKIKKDPADSSYEETAWINNKLVFRSKSFAELAHDLERRYKVNIEFQDQLVKDLVFTGSFTDEGLRDALEALKGSVPFQYRIENKTVYIKK